MAVKVPLYTFINKIQMYIVVYCVKNLKCNLNNIRITESDKLIGRLDEIVVYFAKGNFIRLFQAVHSNLTIYDVT